MTTVIAIGQAVLGIVVLLLIIALLAAVFVSFVRWVDRRAAADRFADEFLPECVDVAAIEATVPDMRDGWTR